MFTAQEALDFSEAGEPIMLSLASALRIVDEHGIPHDDFYEEFGERPESVDAGDLFIWLGY